MATAAAECSGSCPWMPFIYTHSLSHPFIQPVGFDSGSGSGWALGTPDTDLAEIPVPRCSQSSDHTEGQERTSASMCPGPRPGGGGLPAGSCSTGGHTQPAGSSVTEWVSQGLLGTCCVPGPEQVRRGSSRLMGSWREGAGLQHAERLWAHILRLLPHRSARSSTTTSWPCTGRSRMRMWCFLRSK